jgi:hypothetical protein
MKSIRALVTLSAAVLTIVATPAGAQTAPRTTAAAKKEVPRKVLRLEELKVEGKIQKPQAMFLMPRANLNFGELDRSETLVNKVTRAVEKAPF